MKKTLLCLCAVSLLQACANKPQYVAVDNATYSIHDLPEPTGEGALVIGLEPRTETNLYNCQNVEITVKEMTAGGEFSDEPIILGFQPNKVNSYVIFHSIKPGFYVTNQIRCVTSNGSIYDETRIINAVAKMNIKSDKITVSHNIYERKNPFR